MTAEQFLLVAGELPEATLMLQSDGTIVAANRSAARRLGLPNRELVGRSLHEFVADGPEKVDDALRLMARTRSLSVSGLTIACGDDPLSCRCEGFLLAPRTEEEPARVLVRLIPRDASTQQFALLNRRLRELSEEFRRRRKVEEALRAQREWLHVTLTSIGDAVIATDAQGGVTLMNPVAERLTGWNIEEASGRPLKEIFNIVNEETRHKVDNPVAKVLREGIVVGLANHTVLISRDGDERPIDDSAAPIRNSEGHLQGVVLVFHDVSDRRVLERQLKQRAAELEEAHRRKDEFLAVLAHELRNPLAPIRTAAQILRMGGSDAETVGQIAEILERQSKHLTTLVDDLLDVSRITRGKISLRREHVEVGRIVQGSIQDYLPRYEAEGVRLHAELTDTPLWINGDRTRLTQIVENLLDNACKFTPPGGSVVVRLEADRQRNQVVFRVRDTGVGMEPEMMRRLFVPFAQADRTLDRTKGGLGLGLALVKGLVDLHEGQITASSDGPGRGAEFTIRLPLMETPVSLRDVPGAMAPSNRRLRVLIVEDNKDAAGTLSMLVELLGHQAVVATSGNEGLQVALVEKPDVVLCDIGLPGMDGHQVAQTLRQRPEFRQTRMIAITGYGQESDKQQARDAGFDTHLTKPVELARLREELEAKRKP